MTSSDDLIRAAKAGQSGVAREPRRRLSVLACMDARVDPLRILQARPGDLHVVRNAGGLVTSDSLRSLAISQRRLGTVAIDVIMHTDCGMLGLDETALAREIRRDDPAAEIPRFRGFPSLEGELARSVEILRNSPLLPHRDRIRGRVFDVVSGRLRTVIPA